MVCGLVKLQREILQNKCMFPGFYQDEEIIMIDCFRTFQGTNKTKGEKLVSGVKWDTCTKQEVRSHFC